MLIQHRLIGNIPGRGHGNPLHSPAFPLDSVLTTTSNYRAPDPSQVPAEASYVSEDGKFQVFFSTFEVQATHFGRFALVSTSMFRPARTTMRPLIYMNTVTMSDNSGSPLTYLPLHQLLAFDGFYKPAQFASLTSATTSLSSADWVPSASHQYAPLLEPGSAVHRALLVKYWAAASARMFGGYTQPITLSLSSQAHCQSIIESAKSLLLCDILTYLPPAVRNIASMSASVPEVSANSIFRDSALTVVFPVNSNGNPPMFSLCGNVSYPPISPEEDHFISSLLHNGFCSLMRNIVATYLRMTGCTAESQIPFCADYDFVYLIHQVEYSLVHANHKLQPSMYASIWKQLNTILLTRHHLTLSQVNKLLAEVESILLPHILSSGEALSSIDSSIFDALWEKALSAEPQLFECFSDIIAVAPSAPHFSHSIESFPNLTSNEAKKTSVLIQKLSSGFFAHNPISEESIAHLTSAPVVSIIQAYPPIHQALCLLLTHNNEAFPRNQLLTLPLSCILMDAKESLLQAQNLLRRDFVDTLPSDTAIQNLHNAYALFTDDKAAQVFDSYFAECLPFHIDDLQPFVSMIARIIPKADNALCALLASADKQGILFNSTAESILLRTLLPQCSNLRSIGRAYTEYENNISICKKEPSIDRLSRLQNSSELLKCIHYDATNAFCGILRDFSADPGYKPSQLEKLFELLFSQCADKTRVHTAFLEFTRKVSLQSINLKDDYFPQLESMAFLYTRYFPTDVQNIQSLENIAFEYIDTHCKATHTLPSESAQTWLLDQMKRKPTAFVTPILSFYETLLDSSALNAKEQIIAFLPYTSSTKEFPKICAVDQEVTISRFKEYLNTNTYDHAFVQFSTSFKRCGMSISHLLAHTKSVARAALLREFSAFKQPEDYKKAYRTASMSDKDSFYNSILIESFEGFSAAFTQMHRDIQSLDRINDAAKVLHIKENDLPSTVRRLAEIITAQGADTYQFAECLRIMEHSNSDGSQIVSELNKLIREKVKGLPFPQAVYAAMLCHLSSRDYVIRWDSVFATLGYRIPVKLPQPFSPEGTAWFAVIHAVCKSVSALETQTHYHCGPHLLAYLNAGALGDFISDARAKSKRLEKLFPEESILCPLMKQWLEY